MRELPYAANMIEPKTLITDYLRTLSGQPKTPELIRRYVADERLAKHIAEVEAAFPSYEIMIEENESGLNIEIVDQDGRSMFPDGAKEPFDRTRRLIQKLAVPLKALPNRVSVSGHTAATRIPPRPGYGPWELSADRAKADRERLNHQYEKDERDASDFR